MTLHAHNQVCNELTFPHSNSLQVFLLQQVSMALTLSSPCGYPFDEDEEMAVFESTAAEHGGLSRPRLPEISVISPGLDTRQGSCDEERVKVFLRIRPLTETESHRDEEQGCVAVQDEETLLLKAPKESQNMRTAERGITQSMHKFSFSKIFGPETTQQQFYESTMKKMVKDVLQGENRLLYTYGVTNSGKTYTIQGSGLEAGLLPRALVSLFRKLQGRLYGAMDLKPVLYQDVRQLDSGEIRVEEIRRNSLLKENENLTSRRGGNTSIWDSGIGGLSSTSNIATQLEDTGSVCLEPDSLSHSGADLAEGVQFSIWVAFYEIYNEFLYDLLDASPSLQPRKRITLRLSDDKQGNPYVKDLAWIQVRSAEEAWRILRAGRRNQSFASTHLNQNSSRSHSIFSIRVLHIRPEADSAQATHISELTVCDLAGSERCKEQRNGERMKEANNINTSLLTLGRCIAALRHNQNNKSRPPQVVPFRDSKMTRVLQGFFCGRGTSSMVVNINPCASIYDETLQALKFSAIATQVKNKKIIQLLETLEAERALIEERYEDKLTNVQKHLKKFYSQELTVSAKSSYESFYPQKDYNSDIFQQNLRQLRLDLQRLGMDLQSGERACCRNTGGERLRQALTAADETLAKQDQILLDLQNGLALVKADLRRKAESLAQTQAVLPPLPSLGYAASITPGSCKKRGCAVAAAKDTENRPPEKRQFFQSLFPMRTPNRKYNTRAFEEASATPSSRILRSRQQSPPRSPAPTLRSLRGKY
uniref:Kinesin-like protein n=1 Tax=Cyclopterus lumpus TaxID=8103 RepID=A0A8C2ZNY9_CYCLU